jgi:heptosyltransferase-1
VNREAEIWADGVLNDVGLRPVVLLSPGAGWGAKRWPAERYGAVARDLHQRGCMVLVNAGPEERAIAAEVVRASGDVAQAPEFTLERLIALTRRVCLVIAGDTGPLHLACALGKPVVGIYGPTDPKRNGPFGVPFRVLRHPESKRDHTRHVEPEAGLLTITPQQVVEAANELLQKKQ